ncbi:hypothetical protein LCGC14_1969310, partial [marine sediment metagenome]
HYVAASIDAEHLADDSVESDSVEAGLIQYNDTQLNAAAVNGLLGANVELAPTPGANAAIFPVRIALFLDHGGADFIQVNNTDQLALRYSASNEIMEVGSEAQCTAFSRPPATPL